MSYLLIALLFLSPHLLAKDFGTHGHTFAIEEEDLLEYLNKSLVSKGEPFLNEKMQQILTHYKQTLLTPKPVQGLKKAEKYQVNYYDPTVVAKQEIKDSQSNIIVAKGESYNPLQHCTLSQDLLFFDGDDPAQIEWAKSQGDQKKWILVSGRPLDLEKQENRAVYFDQFGLFIAKLKITAVPARVSQESMALKIETIPLKDFSCA